MQDAAHVVKVQGAIPIILSPDRCLRYNEYDERLCLNFPGNVNRSLINLLIRNLTISFEADTYNGPTDFPKASFSGQSNQNFRTRHK